MINIIDWRINSDCMDACEYCYGCKPVPIVNQKNEKIILSKILKSNIKVVNITGGEPMLHSERCLYIINTLYNAGKKIYLSSNGYNIACNMDSIRKSVSLLGVPIDGYNEKTNMINGRSKGSFARIIKILKLSADAGVNIKVGTVVTKKNLDWDILNKIALLLDRYPITVWRIYEVLPENRGEQNRDTLVLDDKKRELLSIIVNQIQQKEHKYQIELVLRQMRSASYFIIQPDGTVMIPLDCVNRVEERVIGNLVDHSFKELEYKWRELINESNNNSYMAQRLKDVIL